jgi:hypothetical protein
MAARRRGRGAPPIRCRHRWGNWHRSSSWTTMHCTGQCVDVAAPSLIRTRLRRWGGAMTTDGDDDCRRAGQDNGVDNIYGRMRSMPGTAVRTCACPVAPQQLRWEGSGGENDGDRYVHTTINLLPMKMMIPDCRRPFEHCFSHQIKNNNQLIIRW